MTHAIPNGLIGQTYSVLRHGGASPERACTELSAPAAQAKALEALFRVRKPGLGADAMTPRYARHDAHVRAVRAAGGYPAIAR
jgi:hypothetical protein